MKDLKMMIQEVWPEYQVEEVLGRGQYGQVFKVKRQHLGVTSYAAVKVIEIPPRGYTAEEIYTLGTSREDITQYVGKITQDFLKENELMEALKGAPNVVNIEDCQVVKDPDSDIGSLILIRMELLKSLEEVEKEKTLSPEEVAKLGIDICEALKICESKNIIHRDIKQGNIFVSKYGVYKLGDFGVAKQLQHMQSEVSQKGTSMYMAPEVYQDKQADKRVDIYALGITLYRLLNKGRFPFVSLPPAPIRAGEQDDALLKRLKGYPLPLPCDADYELGSIILKACAHDRELRYQDAASLQRDLVHWQNNHENAEDAEDATMPLPIEWEIRERFKQQEELKRQQEELERQKEEFQRQQELSRQEEFKRQQEELKRQQEEFRRQQEFTRQEDFRRQQENMRRQQELDRQERLRQQQEWAAQQQKNSGNRKLIPAIVAMTLAIVALCAVSIVVLNKKSGEDTTTVSSSVTTQEDNTSEVVKTDTFAEIQNPTYDGNHATYTELTFGTYPSTQPYGNALSELKNVKNWDSDKTTKINGKKYRKYDDQYYEYEPITWRVLSREGDIVYLMSEEILDVQPYHNTNKRISWADSDMRAWLNSTFYNRAFSAEEKKCIVESDVENNANSQYGTSGGVDTKDKVFLLSLGEVTEDIYYLNHENERLAPATSYAVKRGLYIKDQENYGRWWLRTPGDEENTATNVLTKGGLYEQGSDVFRDTYGVRPVIRVDLQAYKKVKEGN